MRKIVWCELGLRVLGPEGWPSRGVNHGGMVKSCLRWGGARGAIFSETHQVHSLPLSLFSFTSGPILNIIWLLKNIIKNASTMLHTHHEGIMVPKSEN